jgi:hypothetical protein
MPAIVASSMALQEAAKQPYSTLGLIIAIATVVVLVIGIGILLGNMINDEEENG